MASASDVSPRQHTLEEFVSPGDGARPLGFEGLDVEVDERFALP